MKNLLIFLFGAVCGAGGMLIWMRKDIKEDIAKMAENAYREGHTDENEASDGSKNSENSDEDMPFRIGNDADLGPNRVPESVKIEYNQLIKDTENGVESAVFASEMGPKVPILPREEGGFMGLNDPVDQPLGGRFVDNDGAKGIYEIDQDEYLNDRDNEKERYIYYKGDAVVADEYGTIIENPFMFFGSNWMNFVGHYAPNTAFLRNGRLCTNYEILVREGFYIDDYPQVVDYRED